MPYKDWRSLNITDDRVIRWANELRESSARPYVYYITKYLQWAEEKGYWSNAEEMIRDFMDTDDRYKHLDIILDFIKDQKTGTKDRKNRYMAIKNFYEYYRLDLPKPSKAQADRVFRPSDNDKKRAMSEKPLKVEEVRKIIIHAKQPYKAAFMTVFQSAMGLAEYDQFNNYAWRNIVNQLDEEAPIKVDLVREKTSRQDVKKYYTFLGEDSKQLIKEWLKERPEGVDALFVTYNRHKREHVPLTGRLLSNMLTRIAKRIELIKPNGFNRYHIHTHEFRDLFKSLCTLNGVNVIASEFFLGHVIDKLGYDKSPLYDVDFFKAEYEKIEPILNIISNPEGRKADREEKLESELRAENEALWEQLNELKAQLNALFNADPDEVKEVLQNLQKHKK